MVAYVALAAIHLLAALTVAGLAPLPTEGAGMRLSSIMEGLRFVRRRRLLLATFAIDLNAMGFGMPTALFPEFGTGVLGGDASHRASCNMYVLVV
jgi:hypothetical protein